MNINHIHTPLACVGATAPRHFKIQRFSKILQLFRQSTVNRQPSNADRKTKTTHAQTGWLRPRAAVIILRKFPTIFKI